jgi:hypothetical protein
MTLIYAQPFRFRVEICLTIPDTDLTLQLTENAADASLAAYATLRLPLPATPVAPLVSLTSLFAPVVPRCRISPE